jgi:hypothetical protein
VVFASPEDIPNNDMENRIDRKDDESLYQPKIHSERIRELYRLKEATGAPMTVLLDFAIQEFIASYGAPGPLVEEPDIRNVDQETWEEVCEYRRFLDELEYQKCLVELEKMKRNG